MREQFFHDLSSLTSKTTNSKYETEKKTTNLNLTALRSYINYMRERGVTVYPI
ncbi:MAG: hypothetical protein WCG23_01400 [bacterium]